MPPHRHSPEHRQANMTMLRFQDALAADRWDEALSFCSSRLRAAAKEWPSTKEFFTNTMPIEHVLARDFGYWTMKSKKYNAEETFFGMFVTLSELDATPRIDWYWGLAANGTNWEVDYPPLKLDEYIAKKKAALEARSNFLKENYRALDQKAQHVATRLVAESARFAVGSPMLFRVELTNSGPESVHYTQEVNYESLVVMNEQKELVPNGAKPPPPSQRMAPRKVELHSKSTAVLGAKLDLNSNRTITKPGKYRVHFDGRQLAIAQPLPPSPEVDNRFGEDLSMGMHDYLTGTNKFPSNTIEIEVQP